MTRGLFEMGDAHEQNEIHLNKDITHLRGDLKVQTAQLEELTKQLLEMKEHKKMSESQLSEMTKQKETVATNCSKLEATNFGLSKK